MTTQRLNPSALIDLPQSAPAAARAVFALLRKLEHGQLDVQLPDGQLLHFAGGHSPEMRAAIRLRNWNVCQAALKSGDIGFAETFISGDWTTPDLAQLLELFIANRDSIETMIYGSWWGSALYRLKHFFNRNTRSGSKKNIHAHYDLGNAFYRLWLDPSMTYSSAWFEAAGGHDRNAAGRRDADLGQAQWAKVRRSLQEVQLAPGQRLLEIGCGWGGLAEYAAREFGASVTGVTLSTEQLAYGRERAAAAGLAEQVDLQLKDYRDLNAEGEARFDAIASIEMFEAVGREYWPSFFGTVARQLKPGGRACVQTITIRDELFERYLRSTDFIQQYIFPGGLLPSRSAFEQAARDAGLEIERSFDFGLDYAETLARWRVRFLQQEGAVRKLGFDTRFMRIWEFYLAYCEAAFATGNTSVMQVTLRRPDKGSAS
jgi:cyclopropane-fatty-acyl-phospholipid synthase